jgi:hypothetical protein
MVGMTMSYIKNKHIRPSFKQRYGPFHFSARYSDGPTNP